MYSNCTLSLPLVSAKAVLKKSLEISGAGVHWYGKAEPRPGRKMAHLTITAPDMTTLASRFDLLGLEADRSIFGLASDGLSSSGGALVGIIMGSDSDLPTMKDAAEILEAFGVSYEISVVSAHRCVEINIDMLRV